MLNQLVKKKNIMFTPFVFLGGGGGSFGPLYHFI